VKTKQIIAYNIWQIRQELGIGGSEPNDWLLAEQFLQQSEEPFDEDDIYIWIVELKENMIPKKKLDIDMEI